MESVFKSVIKIDLIHSKNCPYRGSNRRPLALPYGEREERTNEKFDRKVAVWRRRIERKKEQVLLFFINPVLLFLHRSSFPFQLSFFLPLLLLFPPKLRYNCTFPLFFLSFFPSSSVSLSVSLTHSLAQREKGIKGLSLTYFLGKAPVV